MATDKEIRDQAKFGDRFIRVRNSGSVALVRVTNVTSTRIFFGDAAISIETGRTFKTFDTSKEYTYIPATAERMELVAQWESAQDFDTKADIVIKLTRKQ